MRRIGILILVVLLAVSLSVFSFGCQPGAATQESEETITEEVSEESTAQMEKTYKVAMITPQKLGDQGVVDDANSGLIRASEELPVEVKVLEPEQGEYEESFRALAEEGYDLIFGLFTATLDGLSRAALDYPDTKFCIILSEFDNPNVKSVFFRDQECTYLTGLLAGQYTQSNVISCIRGADVGDNLRLTAGFFDGAKEINPEVKTIPLMVGSFEDPTKGKELANVAIDQGADIIQEACAKSSLGIVEAIKEKGLPYYLTSNNMGAMELLPDQTLAAGLQKYGNVFYNTIEDLINDEFEAGTVTLGLKDGGLDIEYGSMLTDEDIEMVEEYRLKIENGEIVPEDDPTVFE